MFPAALLAVSFIGGAAVVALGMSVKESALRRAEADARTTKYLEAETARRLVKK